MVRGLIIIGAMCLAACGDRSGKAGPDAAPDVAAALDLCAEGQGAFEGHLCADRELAALGGEVREVLVAEAAQVSGAGAQLLVRNQSRWLEARRIGCGIAEARAAPTAEQQTCLQSELRARAQDAKGAVQEIGGYTFQRLELVNAIPVSAAAAAASGLGDSAPAAITRDIRFPRIDGPQTPEIQRFNELVAQQPQYRLEDVTNELVNYSIAFAGPELISVRFDLSADTLGAAHPNSTSKAVTVLMQQRRVLSEGDVFSAASGWEDFLTQRAVADLTAQYREDSFVPPERDVRETATKAHLWLITERGLTMLFPPYSFGAPYVMGGAEVSIPWADLRPFLSASAPAPIRPAA